MQRSLFKFLLIILLKAVSKLILIVFYFFKKCALPLAFILKTLLFLKTQNFEV